MNIPFHKPYITEEDIACVADSMRSGWLSTGPKTEEFEKRFKEYIFRGGGGGGYAVAVNSATAALHLALKAVGVKAGDEIILPTNTFVATAEVATYFGVLPVLCDIEEKTHNIDASKIEPLITSRTKALIPVHFGGQPCDMDEILAIAGKYNLSVIEDAAHSFPAGYKGKMIGTIGDITCFSFYATKTLCTGEGGMAVTSSGEYAGKIRINRLHGIDRDAWERDKMKENWLYDVVDNGCKYNMSDINGAMGLSQLSKVAWMHEERARVAGKYDEAFNGTRVVPLYMKPDRFSSRHLYVVKVNNRKEVMEELKKMGIGTSVHFIPVHRFSYYRKAYGYRDEDYPVANRVYEKSLSLPIYPGLTAGEIDYVAEAVLNHAE